MKLKIIFSTLVLSVILLNGQNPSRGIVGSGTEFSKWVEYKPNSVDYPEANKTVSGKISANTTWSNSNTYLLEGKVYIMPGVTLTIEPGTVIRCDSDSQSALVILKGAKILADGQKLNPIVFTSNRPAQSRKAGDWSGIIILGSAPSNVAGGITSIGYDIDMQLGSYGGNNPQDDSGIMRYVRIEFAGQLTENKKEQNGLTLAGVGNKTKLEFIQTSMGNDDGFEFLGGNVIANYLISYKNKDDDFDFNLGCLANISNSVAIRNAFISSQAAPRCVELDTFDQNVTSDSTKPLTNVVFNNVTFLNESVDQDGTEGLVREAIYVGHSTELTIKNSVIAGFAPGVYFNKAYDMKTYQSKIRIEQVFLNKCKGHITSELGGAYNEALENHYANTGTLTQELPLSELFLDHKGLNPDFRLKPTNIR